MASQKEIERRKATLRARGVPERFVDAIARRKGSWTPVFVLIICLLAVGFSYLIIRAQDRVMSILATRLYPAAETTLLAHTPEVLGLLARLPMLFVVLLVPVLWLAKVRLRRKARPFPAYDPAASFLREAHSPQPADWAPEKLADLPDDTAFLTALREPWTRKPFLEGVRFAVLALINIMVIASLPLWQIWNGIGIYQTVTLEKVQAYGGKDAGIYPLDHTNYVFIQCKARKRPEIQYVLVTAPNGFDIWAASDPVHNLDADQVVARIGQVDKRLRDLDVMIMTLSRTGPNGPAAIACVDTWVKDAHVKDKAAVERLIFGD